MEHIKNIFRDMGKHIVNGIKYAIPIIIVYSVFLALVNSNIIKSTNFDISEYVYLLIIPVLTAFIANSISEKITIIPAFILGIFLERWGLGFLGGIFGGLFLGYLVRCISSKIKIKNSIINLLVGYIVLGGIAFVISYYAMNYLVRPGIVELLETVTNYIVGIDSTQVVFLVLILSFLTVVDLGGPFNKLAFGFVLQFYLDGFYHITGPVLLSVVLPPIGVYLGLKLLPNRFNEDDHKSSKLALIGGLFGMTEGALQVGFRRPLVIIPILLIGSIVGSVSAVLLGLENSMMLTGILGLFGVSSILVYLGCLIVGASIIFVLMLLLLPKKVVE